MARRCVKHPSFWGKGGFSREGGGLTRDRRNAREDGTLEMNKLCNGMARHVTHHTTTNSTELTRNTLNTISPSWKNKIFSPLLTSSISLPPMQQISSSPLPSGLNPASYAFKTALQRYDSVSFSHQPTNCSAAPFPPSFFESRPSSICAGISPKRPHGMMKEPFSFDVISGESAAKSSL